MTLGPCDLWRPELHGGRIDDEGYGRTSSGAYAHVEAYERAHGPIPKQTPRLVLRHRCDVRPCRALDHLVLGTDRQNAQDRARRGRGRNQHGAQTRIRDRRWG